MFAISRCDVVALEVERDVAKRIRVAVDVQRPHITGATTIVMQLLAEEMREVRGCSNSLSCCSVLMSSACTHHLTKSTLLTV